MHLNVGIRRGKHRFHLGHGSVVSPEMLFSDSFSLKCPMELSNKTRSETSLRENMRKNGQKLRDYSINACGCPVVCFVCLNYFKETLLFELYFFVLPTILFTQG